MRSEKGVGLCDFGANGALDGGFDLAFRAGGDAGGGSVDGVLVVLLLRSGEDI